MAEGAVKKTGKETETLELMPPENQLPKNDVQKRGEKTLEEDIRKRRTCKPPRKVRVQGILKRFLYLIDWGCL